MRREYARKTNDSYWLIQTIIAHGSGSAGCWKTRAREETSRPSSRTTAFTLADSRAIQQTRQSIVQCKPSFIITRDPFLKTAQLYVTFCVELWLSMSTLQWVTTGCPMRATVDGHSKGRDGL